MSEYKEAHYRSIIKALSWRAFATLATILIVFAFTRKLVLSLSIGAVEIVVKLFLYYLHERIWSLIPIGKKRHPLSSLRIDKELKKEDLEIIKQKLEELGYIN